MTFQLILNDQNEIETFELLNLFSDLTSEVSSSSDDESDDGSADVSDDGSGNGSDDVSDDGSDDGSDDVSDGGYWMGEEPEGGIWYNGDDYVGGVYVGPRDW